MDQNTPPSQVHQLADLVTFVVYKTLHDFAVFPSITSSLSGVARAFSTNSTADYPSPPSTVLSLGNVINNNPLLNSPGLVPSPASPLIDRQKAIASNSSLFNKFCRTLLNRTCTPVSIVVVSLKYLERLSKLPSPKQVHLGSEFRVWVVALILAIKFLDDHRLTNRIFAELTGMKIEEINRMEFEFLALVNYRLRITDVEYQKWALKLQAVSDKIWEWKQTEKSHPMVHVGPCGVVVAPGPPILTNPTLSPARPYVHYSPQINDHTPLHTPYGINKYWKNVLTNQNGYGSPMAMLATGLRGAGIPSQQVPFTRPLPPPTFPFSHYQQHQQSPQFMNQSS